MSSIALSLAVQPTYCVLTLPFEPTCCAKSPALTLAADEKLVQPIRSTIFEDTPWGLAAESLIWDSAISQRH
jgi:hypothetical protein